MTIPARLVNQLVTPNIGTINPAQAVAAQRTYITAFFGQHLYGRASALLGKPSARFPDVTFLGR